MIAQVEFKKVKIVFFVAGLISLCAEAVSPNRLQPDERNTIEIFKKIAPLVVNVSNQRYARRGFFDHQITEVPAGTGSGFLWDRFGHVVTNFHVIQGAHKINVSFGSGVTYKTKLVGVEPRKDTAVLKIIGWKGGLATLDIANSSKLVVGQKTIAIGSPFGLDQTLTTGIVSALGRSIPGIGHVTIRDMIQTDASINPGNSGGPLLDSEGKLIGMNTMIVSNSGSSAGIGFAVPANTIQRVVKQIIQYGRVRQPGLGISLFSDDIARQLGKNGVLIRMVQRDSGSDIAGLRGTRRDRFGNIVLGDMITHIGSEVISNFDDLYNSLGKYEIGQLVEVVYVRDGRVNKVSVRLSEVSD